MFSLIILSFLQINGVFMSTTTTTTNNGATSSSSSSLTSIPSPPLSAPNNIIKLIIKTYVQELLQNPHLHAEQLRHKLAKMSDYISTHPALHQRYLWVGSEPPTDYNPDLHMIQVIQDSPPQVFQFNQSNRSDQNLRETDVEQMAQELRPRMMLMKRKQTDPATGSNRRINHVVPAEQTRKHSNKEQGLPSEEICETKQKWEQLNETHDLFDNKVKVVQTEDLQQFVFTYRCAKNKGKCLGISSLFESECTERYGWMYMYYKTENKPPQWGYVNAPHHCACKLKPIYQPAAAMSPRSARSMSL